MRWGHQSPGDELFHCHLKIQWIEGKRGTVSTLGDCLLSSDWSIHRSHLDILSEETLPKDLPFWYNFWQHGLSVCPGPLTTKGWSSALCTFLSLCFREIDNSVKWQHHMNIILFSTDILKLFFQRPIVVNVKLIFYVLVWSCRIVQ